ncbi:hypothetical protein F5884DRAFT_897531 [Xylogone sp. PMI_703]|nr:hypothetical protein F5884DRAFT_897531 [Xylogone sp. PMI_703]
MDKYNISCYLKDDRSAYVPPHRGENVLPNCVIFGRLVRAAHKTSKVAIRDLRTGISATHAQLLTDVLNVRNFLLKSLDTFTLESLERHEEVYLNLLGPGGYEYTVGFLAIVALGAVVVPLSPDLPVREATYYVNKCCAVAVLTTTTCTVLGKRLQSSITSSTNSKFRSIELGPLISMPPLKPADIVISSDLYLNDNEPGLVIFTSGTTGPPKASVKRRAFLSDAALAIADMYGITSDDVVLHVLPVHHATGIGITLLPFLLSGGCIEFRSGGFDAAWMWKRWKQGGLTFFSGVPTIYMRMMQYYEENLANLPAAERNLYIAGVRQFKSLLCGTSALPRNLQHKWTTLRDGKAILTRYGATEFGAVFMVSPTLTNVPENSVGLAFPGIDVKLSNGDEGEVLVKTPNIFAKYLGDPEATKHVHDSEGYFRTGDIAYQKGDYYFIMGRASVDIIKSGGYKISALDVEREILGLSYISEAMVVGVEDEEFGQRVAAAVVLKKQRKSLSIDELRRDLRQSLTAYKMPTMLRVVEELPKSATGKVSKKNLAPQIFPLKGHDDVQSWTSRSVARL